MKNIPKEGSKYVERLSTPITQLLQRLLGREAAKRLGLLHHTEGKAPHDGRQCHPKLQHRRSHEPAVGGDWDKWGEEVSGRDKGKLRQNTNKKREP